MNLDLFKQGLILETAKNFSWEEFDSGENSIGLKTSLSLKKYDDDICMEVVMYEDSTLIVTFDFDFISCNKETLLLVNHFNRNQLFFKAYIKPVRRGNLLTIRHATPNCSSVEQANNIVQFLIDELNSDYCARFLIPLTVVTEG